MEHVPVNIPEMEMRQNQIYTWMYLVSFPGFLFVYSDDVPRLFFPGETAFLFYVLTWLWVSCETSAGLVTRRVHESSFYKGQGNLVL